MNRIMKKSDQNSYFIKVGAVHCGFIENFFSKTPVYNEKRVEVRQWCIVGDYYYFELVDLLDG